ncbi:TPA: hypothetical protein EYM82_25025, partial [Candidatus Poribacteria bacterium]|nr:hypothetical protein [Candidatus Poribacteria bacterium]
MKRKDFFLSATAGLFTLNQVSEAQQRPGRGERGDGNRRGGRGGMRGGMSSMITNLMGTSWVGLTFVVKVDDKALLKARPVYQKTMDDSKTLMEEAMAAGDWQSMRPKMEAIRNQHKEALQKILTEEQMKGLEKYEQEQRQSQMERFGGGNRQRGGRGGERRG